MIIQKWIRELKAFIGIKNLILEGNIYDEYPVFTYKDGEAVGFDSTDSLEQVIYSLTDHEKITVFFFDPLLGFSVIGSSAEAQKEALQPLFEGYSYRETAANYGTRLCYMPDGKKCCHEHAENARYIWAGEIIQRAVTSNIFPTNVLFVMNFASRLEQCNVSEKDAAVMYMNLMKAVTAVQTSPEALNTLVFIVDKTNDIPAWVYLNNPNIKTITVPAPDRTARRICLENLCGVFEKYRVLGDSDNIEGKNFVASTEGLKLTELKHILRLAGKMKLEPCKIDAAFRLYKYGVRENPWESLDRGVLEKLRQHLNERVIGQEEAVEQVVKTIGLAVSGLSGIIHGDVPNGPRGVLFLAGPSGVGKTETAKAIAKEIFGDENAFTRFDMSEYRADHSDQKLFGAPPGYVGFEAGGQLTNAVKEKPFSVLLFDEIDKAAPSVMEKFLQILDGGRLTDGRGETVYFNDTFIIFTSNIGTTKEEVINGRVKKIPAISIAEPLKEDTPESRAALTALIKESVKQHFDEIGRPEIMNRIGENNVIVYQFINKSDAEKICRSKCEAICRNVELQKNIALETDGVMDFLCEKAVLARANGGRGIEKMLDHQFLTPLADFMMKTEQTCAGMKLRAVITDKGEVSFEASGD